MWPCEFLYQLNKMSLTDIYPISKFKSQQKRRDDTATLEKNLAVFKKLPSSEPSSWLQRPSSIFLQGYIPHNQGALCINALCSIISKEGRPQWLKCSSVREELNGKWHGPTMEYCRAVKRNELMLCVSIWIDKFWVTRVKCRMKHAADYIYVDYYKPL